MIRWRRAMKRAATTAPRAIDDLHEWVLSLPWVVEWACGADTPGVRSFAVDCEPLGRRRVWLLTGVEGNTDWGGSGVAVVLPQDAATEAEDEGEGHGVALLPAAHVLVSLSRQPAQRPRQLERLLLNAYGHAMSGPTETDMA